MKTNLEYTLPEEYSEFRLALDGWKWKNVCWNLDEYLRGRMKYEDLDSTTHESFVIVREKLNNLIEKENLSLED